MNQWLKPSYNDPEYPKYRMICGRIEGIPERGAPLVEYCLREYR